MSSNSPIGVFDSGVGGLSVLREIRRGLPYEDLLYVADSGNAPYGNKAAQWIEDRSIALVDFLLAQGAKAIVVACNTATGAAVATLRSRFPAPIVAIEPAIKPAVLQSQSGVVGVLATPRTIASEKFATLLAKFEKDAKVLVQACPGLAEQVEAGDFSSEKTRALVASYVLPLVQQGADVLALGCTHYPFLNPLIRNVVGPDVALVDPAAAVSRELQRRLVQSDLLSTNTRAGRELFWTSGPVERVREVIGGLWRRPISLSELPG